MEQSNYDVNNVQLSTILNNIENGKIAIPEIQRPFVWRTTKVRNLILSLYRKYPIGYIITWENPSVRLKDGSSSYAKSVIIDGQQRITAMSAALLGKEVLNDRYKKIRIKIAFNPMEEKFETLTPAIEKNPLWIPDISVLFTNKENALTLYKKYLVANENKEIDEDKVFNSINALSNVINNGIGYIALSADLGIETVTEIFSLINTAGESLEQSDFVMSKIASKEEYNGVNIRKAIDYFCHFIQSPADFSDVQNNDTEFSISPYWNKIKWVKDKHFDIYKPSYSDIIRVAFTHKFYRGKTNDLVALLSGRNFEKKSYEESISMQSFSLFEEGISNFFNQTYFERFIMIIKSIGFISEGMISSTMALDFAYSLYLYLKTSTETEDVLIEKYVQRWFVLSLLIGRYSGSSETKIDEDIKKIKDKGIKQTLLEMEQINLSSNFWEYNVPSSLSTTSTRSVYYLLYLAALCKNKVKGFLSNNITVANMIEHRGDVHHIYPKKYLEKNGLSKDMYNQIANYVYCETPINIKIQDVAPMEYFAELQSKLGTEETRLSGIEKWSDIKRNLSGLSLPAIVLKGNIDNYEIFLEKRRKMISNTIKLYWENLC